MLQTVQNYINRHHLMSREGLFLVALSGGADSVALFRVLCALGYRVEAVHCNFQLRGEESLRDEQFVVQLCEQYGIPLHRAHYDTYTYATLHGISIEMAARELRYAYFEQLRRDLGAEAICVAHHRDDSVETLLINLLRGTGLRGLTGIHPRQGHVVRPLLCVGHYDIVAWLQQQGQAFVTDSSNLMPDVVRNRLRLQALPLLSDIAQGAVTGIARTAILMSEALKVYDDAISHALHHLLTDEGSCLRITDLQATPSPLCVLFEWLSSKGFSSSVIIQIYNSLDTVSSGKTWRSETHELCVARGCLWVQPQEKPHPVIRLPEEGIYLYGEHLRLRLHRCAEVVISRSSDKACLDAAKVAFPLTLRPASRGDWFIPFGMRGRKLVSDFLTDRKYSVFEKRRQLVLTDAHGQLLWVVGLRIDARFALTEQSKEMLLVEYKKVFKDA